MVASSNFEKATFFIADIGPVIAYYTIGSFATRYVACFGAAAVGVIGSSMDFTNYHYFNPNGRSWPRLLNTAEMVVYIAMAILFVVETNCKMWANSLQMAGITIAFLGGMGTYSQCVSSDIEHGDDYEGKSVSSPEVRRAAREIAWIVGMALIVMTSACFAVPIYRVVHDHPANNSYRIIFNWIVPMASLVLAALVITMSAGPKLGKARQDAVLNPQNNSEEGSLLSHDDNNNIKKQSNEQDHPLLFPGILLLSLIPVICIGSLSSLSGDQCY